MAYTTEERSPWPWVIVALGLLAFVAAVIFLTRPAELAPPQGGNTVIVNPPAQNAPAQPGDRTTIIERDDDDGASSQPSGDTTIIQRNEGPSGNAPATGTAPPSGGTGNETPANSPMRSQPSGNSPAAAPGSSSRTSPGTGGSSANAPMYQPASGTTEEQATPVAVEMGEWYVRLEPSTIPSGPTRFQVRNAGGATHGFEIEGQGIEKQGRRIQPGGADTVTADLKPGDYTIYCYVGNHRERGMEAKLRVRAGQ